MVISAALVKELREKTGAGVMECKNALSECDGDFTKAEAVLRKRGAVIAKAREERTTNQGRIFGRFTEEAVSLVELRCETDFVGENAVFLRLGEECVREAHEGRLSEASERMRDLVVEAVAQLRENIVINSIHTLVAEKNDCLAGYVHDGGRIASLLRLSLSRPGLCSNDSVRTLASDLALHVVAFAPQFIEEDEIEEDFRAALEEEFGRELAGSGKPAAVVRQAVAGKWRKYLTRVCLSDQPFIRNEDRSVRQEVELVQEATGASIIISRIAYVAIAPAVCL